MTWQTGEDVALRGSFVQNGKLSNSKDTSFRALDDHWPVFAFSVDLGSVATTTSPVVWAVGQAHDPAIRYTSNDGSIQSRSSYFRTKYNNDMSTAVSIFFTAELCATKVVKDQRLFE